MQKRNVLLRRERIGRLEELGIVLHCIVLCLYIYVALLAVHMPNRSASSASLRDTQREERRVGLRKNIFRRGTQVILTDEVHSRSMVRDAMRQARLIYPRKW